MNTASISEVAIRSGASEESFARGVQYYHDGLVESLILRGDRLSAEVQGSDEYPYVVTAHIAGGAIQSASCTCPYDWGGWCKHIVAALLAFSHAPTGTVMVRPPLAELLAPLSREQLAALLVRLADAEPELIDLIEGMIASTAPVVAVAAAATRVTPSSIDTKSFIRQVRSVFSGYSADEYYAAGGIVSSLDPALTTIRAALTNDDADGALALLEALTDEYGSRWYDYDDSDGELGDFFDQIGQLWAEALLAADLWPEARSSWLEKLQSWHAEAEEYGVEGLAIGLQAAEEGWEAPWLKRALQGRAQPGEYAGGDWDRALPQIRLRVLERQGQVDAALNLAQAYGMAGEAALILARMGRSAEARELGMAQLNTATEALALAQALLNQQDTTGALVVGERGLSLAEPRAELAIWLMDLAQRAGSSDLALRAGEEALRSTPSLALYQQLPALAGSNWPAVRERVLSMLRSSGGWGTTGGRIDIFLHEGMLDNAIALVEEPYAQSDDLLRVMNAALSERPDWVITKAKARAESIIDATKSQYYTSAVEWLRQVRAAYLSSGRKTEWDGYYQELRANNRRKSKLIALLDSFDREKQ
jgi:uncharacterized Zn finger protein